MPQVSFIVPVYNVEPYIRRCIDSILNQSFSDFELILVDDGSPDGCGVICDEYAEKDSRVRVIHQKNGGLSAARNAGVDWVFSNSNSEWLTFVDSDDWVHKDYLKILLEMATESKSEVSMCNYIGMTSIESDKHISDVNSKTVEFRFAYVEHYCMCMPAWAKLYNRKLFAKIRFPIGKLHEDAYITHLLMIEAGKICLCEIPLYYYFSNMQSITRSCWFPKRMDQIEAHELRIAYWKHVEYNECYIRELRVYIEALTYQLRQLQDMSNIEYAGYQKILQEKLRKALYEARQVGLYPFVEEFWGEYTLAYPQKLQRRLLYIFLRITGK